MAIAIGAHKIAYMALPKAGCSSVKAALAGIDPSVTLPAAPVTRVEVWHSIYPTRRFRRHRWDEFAEGWWRFCVVRDPFRRLMSAYANRVVERGDLKNSPKIRNGRFDLPVDPDPDFFFQNLVQYQQASSVIKHHTLGAHLFLGPLPLRYERVYKTDELAILARDLSERAGKPVTMPRNNPSHLKITEADLQPKTRDALRGFMDQEYRYLADYYENPLA